MRDVEAGHHEWAAVREHDRRGFGVGPHVELAGRGAIAERAAAHQRDSGDPASDVGRGAQGERDVGQRADRNEPHVVGTATGFDDERDGIGSVERSGRCGKIGAVESARTVDEGGGVRLGEKGPRAACMDRHVEAEQVAHDERVVGRAIEWCVPGDGGDPDEVRVVSGGHDRQGVVMARIAVEQHAGNGRRGHSPSMSPPAVPPRSDERNRRMRSVGSSEGELNRSR